MPSVLETTTAMCRIEKLITFNQMFFSEFIKSFMTLQMVISNSVSVQTLNSCFLTGSMQ